MTIQPLAILASSGGHDYLYGLFFLILALIIGAATKHFLQKVPLPFTVLLLLIGLGMGALNRAYGPHGGHAHEHGDEHAAHAEGLWHKVVDTVSGAITWGGNLDGHLILYVFLPILIFEAGFALDVHTFKKSVLNAFYLAGPGIVTATIMTGSCFAGMIMLFGDSGGVLADWNVEAGAYIWLISMLFGAVVSATDPVAVVALLKELGASKKLGTLIEGESLLNDGTAIVAFVILSAAVFGTGTFTVGAAVIGFGKIGAAGGLLGVLIGLIAILWMRKVFNDPMVEITVVLVTSYAVFFICEYFFHVSGVLGLVALGILMAGVGSKRISPEVAHFMHEFWEMAAFIANVIIFIVVGVVIAQKVQPEPMDYAILGLVYLAIHVVRGINILAFYPLMKKAGYGLPKKDAIVVWWGALRGAIGLALALVVYSEHLRYEFQVEEGGSGYKEGTTGIFVASAEEANRFAAIAPARYHELAFLAHAKAEISHGKIVGISQSVETAEKNLGFLSSGGSMDVREKLSTGEQVVFIVGEGSGAVAKAALIGVSTKVREQFLFLISGIVLLTLLVNATTIKGLVNRLGLTALPAVKKLMFSNASGNIVKGCETEMDLLKGDRFLSGANWSVVRKYLPEPVTYPLTADEVAEMDTLSETRRRLLEKEKSSYWAQFKEGVLGAQSLGLLDNNLSEFLDLQGKEPLHQREYLEKILGIPKLLEALKDLPFFKNSFTERLAVVYDAAKAYVVAQDEVVKLVDGLASDLDDTGDAEKVAQVSNLLKNEIRQNRLLALNYLKDLHEQYPEVTVGIETKDAIRSVLNHERTNIKKLRKEGMLEPDETDRMVTAVEERMKDVMESSLELRIPEPEEVLREVTWVKGLPDRVISKIVDLSEQRSYNSGDRIMEQGGAGDGMIVITRGSVQVAIGDLVVDLLGRGAVIGEMSVLAGVPRTANVLADTSVTALWLSTESMQQVMSESSDLSSSLWKTAGSRFAENIISSRDPYRQWTQIQLRRWLNEGSVISPEDGEKVDLYGKTAVLIAGTVNLPGQDQPMTAPLLLDVAEATFSSQAKIFLRS
ncbi:MAG: hypothetical protein CMI31_03990 [Opitutae bacterium]|nr:hypothetical protein [Opitutae bacterium]|tara:strand:- start:121 stop:3309 length:3189 start_codon:yes stop_codon:yes gene_type:complete